MSPRRAWAAYAASVLVAALALVALTQRALEADRAEATARQQAAVEENVRLALWRIDSAVGALVARETANVRRTRPLPPVHDGGVDDGVGGGAVHDDSVASPATPGSGIGSRIGRSATTRGGSPMRRCSSGRGQGRCTSSCSATSRPADSASSWKP